MSIERIPLEGQTAYAELLDRLLRDAAGGKPGDLTIWRRGSPTANTVVAP